MTTSYKKTGKTPKPLYRHLKKKDMKLYLTCEICGRKYKNLASHIFQTHEIKSREYKEMYPETEFFVSDDTRVKLSYEKDGFLHTKKRLIKDEEIEFIKDNFLQMSLNNIALHLALSVSTVKDCVEKYCTDKRRTYSEYTADEVDYIIENFKNITTSEIAKNLKRPIESVQWKIVNIGLTRDQTFAKNLHATFYKDGAPEPLCNEKKMWIKEELDYCKKNRNRKTSKELGEFLGRSENSVSVKLVKMKIRSEKWWTDEDTDFLKKNYGNMCNNELSKILGRTAESIQRKGNELGLRKNDHYSHLRKNEDCDRFWRDEDINFLTNNYGILKTAELSQILGRSAVAVRHRANALGLRKITSSDRKKIINKK